MSELRVAFQVGFLHLVADEIGIAGGKLLLDELDVSVLAIFRKLFAPHRLLHDEHQVHRIGCHFMGVEIKGLRQHLVGEARRRTVHAFVDAAGIPVFLYSLGVRIGVLQRFAVVHPHLRVQAGILVLFQPCQH